MKSRKSKHDSSSEESGESEQSVESVSDDDSSSDSEDSEPSTSDDRRKSKKKRKKQHTSDSDSDSEVKERRPKKHKHKKKKRKHAKKRKRFESESEEGGSEVVEVSPKRHKHKHKHSKHKKTKRVSVSEGEYTQDDSDNEQEVPHRVYSTVVREKPRMTTMDDDRRRHRNFQEVDTYKDREGEVERFYRGSSKDPNRRYQQIYQDSREMERYDGRQIGGDRRYEHQVYKEQHYAGRDDRRDINRDANWKQQQRQDYNYDTRRHEDIEEYRNKRYQQDRNRYPEVEQRGYSRREIHQEIPSSTTREGVMDHRYRGPRYDQRQGERDFSTQQRRDPVRRCLQEYGTSGERHQMLIDRQQSPGHNRRSPHQRRRSPERPPSPPNESPVRRPRSPPERRHRSPPERTRSPQRRPHSPQERPRPSEVKKRFQSSTDVSGRDQARNGQRDSRSHHSREGRSIKHENVSIEREDTRSEIRRVKREKRSEDRGGRRERNTRSDNRNYEWGKEEVKKEQDIKKETGDKEKPNFEVSGALAAETNTVNGVVIKYSEPTDAKMPKRRWRFYPFKGDKALPILYIHRLSSFLIGRDRKVCDIPLDHPSISKQHAALQYRAVPFERADGTTGRRVRPYIIDLESANGTFVNNNKIEPRRYVELMERDVVKFGFSQREYVLLHENSKGDLLDDDDDLKPTSPNEPNT